MWTRNSSLLKSTLILAASVCLFSGSSVATQKGDLKSESPIPFSYFRGEPLRIGNQIQLLVDDYLIEDRWKLKREVGRVNKFMRNPVIVQDKPWEDAVGGYPSVLYDDKSDKHLMWY